jgi:bifunctional enzyme CysN/CysC
MDLLRIVTAGSVDDGKSTLIGRLLFDSKAIDDDVLSAVEDASRRHRTDYVNLALLTDGLRAEREQGITIDVAYRYFSTSLRKFILADTPGHVQYTRNMVTGASTAEVALIMVDARNGMLEQSRRHSVIASLLGIKQIVVCVNKMDLVDHDQGVYEAIKQDFTELMTKIGIQDVIYIPTSALNGDNVVKESNSMPWFNGAPLLTHLEHLPVGLGLDSLPLRLPVQHVIRPFRTEYHDYRGYAGSIASGILHRGDTVRILPSGHETIVTSIETPWGSVEKAGVPDAVTVLLNDNLDVTRGEMICSFNEPAQTTTTLNAIVCWMDDQRDMNEGEVYRIKQTTRSAKAVVKDIVEKLNVTTLTGEPNPESLRLNEIGRINLQLSSPLVFDNYTSNRTTGSFVLINEATNATVAAGMIGEPRFSFMQSELPSNI